MKKPSSTSMALLSTAFVAALGVTHLTAPAVAQSDTQAVLEQSKVNDAYLKKGKELFNAQCVSCHGDQGKGDGLAAAALNPPPRNFHTEGSWKNGRDFAGMYKTLEEGIAGGAMGAYSHLSAKDRVALIHYVRSFNQSIYPEITAKQIETLNAEYDYAKALADSDKKAAAIPVDLAIAKLVEEAAPARKKVEKAYRSALKGSSKGAQMFRKASYDPYRALTVLNNAKANWKGSLKEFAQLVLSDAEQNGFKSNVGALSQSDWQALHSYLKSII